jgi:hypothetical protein
MRFRRHSHTFAYPNLLNKKPRPLLNVSTTLFLLPYWFFVDAGEN